MPKSTKSKRPYTRKAKLIHEYNERGRHRLVMGTKEGQWAGYSHIALLGKFAATTEYYSDLLPRVFKFEPTDAGALMRGTVPLIEEAINEKTEAA